MKYFVKMDRLKQSPEKSPYFPQVYEMKTNKSEAKKSYNQTQIIRANSALQKYTSYIPKPENIEYKINKQENRSVSNPKGNKREKQLNYYYCFKANASNKIKQERARSTIRPKQTKQSEDSSYLIQKYNEGKSKAYPEKSSTLAIAEYTKRKGSITNVKNLFVKFARPLITVMETLRNKYLIPSQTQ
jgi:hypothetical protein